MTTLREAAQQAVEALDLLEKYENARAMMTFEAIEHVQEIADKARKALRAALEEPTRTQRMRDAGYTRRPTAREMTAQTPCDIAEDGVCEVIDCCRSPKQAEPVAWVLPDLLPVFSFKTAQLWKRPFAEDQIPLYTAPPQRKPLTEEEMGRIYVRSATHAAFARAIERAHGIGGDDEQV